MSNRRIPLPTYVLLNRPLLMERNNLENLPGFPVSMSYSFRSYLPGDRQTWTDIQRATELYKEITEDTFAHEFGFYQQALLARQFFVILPDGKAVGTATAWYEGSYGLIRHLAVIRNYAGIGLEEALIGEACRRLRELGYEQARARPTSARIFHIACYLDCGFKPVEESAEDKAIWEQVFWAIHEMSQPYWIDRLGAFLKATWLKLWHT